MLQRMVACRSGRLFDVSLDELRRAFEGLSLRSHDLRHFRYTYLKTTQIPKPILDYWLGHAGVGMGKIYDHSSQIIEDRKKYVNLCGIGFDPEPQNAQVASA
jgi:integrase